MTDEVQAEQPNNNPNYLTRKQLADRLAAAEAQIAALQAAPVSALEQHLQRELDDARKLIEALGRPQTPTGPGIAYKGAAQAKEDCWFPDTGYHYGPKDGTPGDVFQVNVTDYWPGVPYRPVIVTGTSELGRPIVEPHPDFPPRSH